MQASLPEFWVTWGQPKFGCKLSVNFRLVLDLCQIQEQIWSISGADTRILGWHRDFQAGVCSKFYEHNEKMDSITRILSINFLGENDDQDHGIPEHDIDTYFS